VRRSRHRDRIEAVNARLRGEPLPDVVLAFTDDGEVEVMTPGGYVVTEPPPTVPGPLGPVSRLSVQV
jgi:hypothetical protein